MILIRTGMFDHLDSLNIIIDMSAAVEQETGTDAQCLCPSTKSCECRSSQSLPREPERVLQACQSNGGSLMAR